MRWLWFAAGWLMVALGFVGAMLPVMPTTIFLIMAVGCFARSSPRFERWLLEHPRFGRPLRQWREEGAISRKGRRMAFAGMAAGYVIFWVGARPSWPLALGAGLFFVAGALYVGSRPLPRSEQLLSGADGPLSDPGEGTCRQGAAMKAKSPGGDRRG